MSGANLKATVDAWNAACAAGEDAAYGRKVQLTALDTAPYYAWKTQNTNIGSIGGLIIDTDARILDVDGNPDSAPVWRRREYRRLAWPLLSRFGHVPAGRSELGPHRRRIRCDV